MRDRGDNESNFDLLLGSVQLSVGGVYSHRLRQKLIDTNVRSGLDSITDDLIGLQRDGLISFRGRKWMSALPALDADVEESLPSFQEKRPDPRKKTLRAIPASVMGGALRPREGAQYKHDPSVAGASWDVFKTLGAHYIECLRLGAASRASHDAEKHEKQFHVLKFNARWWPDEAGARPIRITRGDLGAGFLEGLAKRVHDPLLIGYPLSVSYLPNENVYLVTPMAILQCEFKLDDAALTVVPMSSTPVLNPNWIKKAHSRREFRASLRRLAELTDTEFQNDENGDATLAGREGWADVEQMARMTAAHLPSGCADRLMPANTLGGLYLPTLDQLQNCAGLFLISENNYTKGAQADIRAIIRNDNLNLSGSALGSFFAGEANTGIDMPVAAPFDLSEDQFIAVKSALKDPVTVISGPPGTGKSQVVASIMLSAAMNKKTVLFSSHTHKAIDAVQERVDELTPDRPLLMRAGGGDELERIDFKSAVHALIASLRDGDNTFAHSANMSAIADLNSEIESVLELADGVSNITRNLGRLWDEKQERQRQIPHAQSATDAEMVKTSLYGTRFFAAVCRWLASVFRRRSPVREPLDTPDLSVVDMAELEQCIKELEKAHKAAIKALQENASDDDYLCKYSVLKDAAIRALGDFLPTLEQTDPDHRNRLAELQGDIGMATTSAAKLEVWQRYADVIVSHFPIWSGTALSIPSRVPMVPKLFDYLIIDEATTCNIGQSLPLLARARHAIVVGDKMQTGLIGDLDPGREREMLADAGLGASEFAKYSYSQVSLFDLANSLPTAKRHILRDHFRSDPQIAGYISDTFYRGQLLVRTNQHKLQPPKGTKTGLHWSDISGPIESAGKGCRSESEALAIAEHISDLIRVKGYKGSIGVVTPFQRQAQLIASELERRISFDERQQASLIVGTSHAFQGDARDLVLVSLCYGSKMPRGSDWFLRNHTDWLNVAISRARAVCHIFGDKQACLTSSIRHISRLVRYLDNNEDDLRAREPIFESPWERALYEALAKAGITPITQYPLCGRRLDMAVITNKLKLDVEVDGDTYHRDRDGFRKMSDYWRDHAVTSLGWQVQRFWVYELKENMGGCVERIKELVNG